MLTNKINGLRALARFDNRWQLFAGRLLFRRRGLQVYTIGSVQIVADESTGDQAVVRELFSTQTYSRFFPSLELPPTINVLDVGSHIGTFTLLLKARGLLIRKGACVEMNPSTFSRMRFNIEYNFPRGVVKLFNQAVAGDSGEVTLRLASGSTGDNIYDGGGPTGETVRVPIVAFDDLVDSAFTSGELIDLCRIDIESAEYDLLAGRGQKGLSRCRNVIIELHERRGHRPAEALQAFEKFGFEPVGDADSRWPNVFCLRNTTLEETEPVAWSAV